MAQAQAKPEFEKGDYVSWKYGAGKATGYVVEKLTEPVKLGSKKFQASAEEPKYKIKSDKSGKIAIRNPETLEKIKSGEPPLEADRSHDENGADEYEEEEDMHVEDGDQEKQRSDDVHDAAGDHEVEEEAYEDGEQNGTRKRLKSESEDKTVDNVAVAEALAPQPQGEEALNGNGTDEEHTNGKHEAEDVMEALESEKSKEEAPHRLPHEEVSQPGQFTDLNAV